MWHFKLKASWLNCLSFRIGKQKKFADQEVKEVHDAASSFMSKAKLNLHENVPEFDEDNPQCFEIKFVTVHKTPSDNLSKNFFFNQDAYLVEAIGKSAEIQKALPGAESSGCGLFHCDVFLSFA